MIKIAKPKNNCERVFENLKEADEDIKNGKVYRGNLRTLTRTGLNYL